MKKLAVLILIFYCNQLNAQTNTVSGNVVDSLQQAALQGATITLVDSNGVKLKTTSTDAQGFFKLVTEKNSLREVIISFAGFKTKKVQLTYNQLAHEYKLGSLYLYPDVFSIAEVIVKGIKPPVSFKIDRQVFKTSQFAAAANGTGIDVVRNLPSVSVNGQGELSLRGSTSFLVLLNGKTTQGDPAFVLNQLPADAIESIEIITNPSAMYDADGKSGIINIITKNGVEDGLMVQASVMGGLPAFNTYNNQRNKYPHRHGADVSAAFRKNKWDLSGGFNYLRNDLAGYREGDVFTIINNIKTSFPSTGERSFQRYNYGGRLAAAYEINKSNQLSAGFYMGKRFQARVADLLYNNQRQDLSNGNSSSFTYFNENTQQKEGVFSLANIDYTHLFADKSKLVFSALYERADLSGLTSNSNLSYPSLKDTIQYTENPSGNPLNAYRLKLDYSKKVGNGNFQAGYQYRYDVQDGRFLYLTKIAGTNNFTIDPDFTSNVKLTNHIHAGYLQYGAKVKRFSYNAGVRLEESERNLLFSLNNQKTKLPLTNFFPSVQLRYEAWDRAVLKTGYSRRIKRTNNYELNPFPEREHSETLEQGDPQLLPELIGTYEAGLEQSFSKGSFYVTLYHQQTKNPIQRVNKIFNDTILNRVFTNAGRAVQTGVEANFTSQVTGVWQTIVGGNVYKYDIKGAIFNGAVAVRNNSWVYSINTTQSFSLPKRWMLQLSINYLSLRATAQGEDGYFLTPNFTVKKTSVDKRWSFQLQWLNMDAGLKKSNRQRITTYGADFYTTTNYVYETDQVQLSLSFNLLRKNRKINLPVSEMGEKEF
ncbi:MAG: TonB-dependent receptor [Chitinophagaceae bacterium]|nr:TonB-dependent receptor [Chitinophagaceae bacterium]